MFDNLIRLWKEMEANAANDRGYRGYLYYSEDAKETIEVINEINTLLIDRGSINHTNMLKLRLLGFNIFPVERDSFGWLIGACIKKDTKCGVYFG